MATKFHEKSTSRSMLLVVTVQFYPFQLMHVFLLLSEDSVKTSRSWRRMSRCWKSRVDLWALQTAPCVRSASGSSSSRCRHPPQLATGVTRVNSSSAPVVVKRLSCTPIRYAILSSPKWAIALLLLTGKMMHSPILYACDSRKF